MTRALLLRAGLPCLLAASAAAAGERPRVLAAAYAGVISPVSAEFFAEAVSRAQEGGYEALILQLDTPGGLDTSMRAGVQSFLGSKVPVVVYVAPAGARAASAGVFLTVAAHAALMAPGTNIGAAHPVNLGSLAREKADKTLETKAVSDAAAYLKALAQKRGRNQAWAVEAVSKSTSIPALEAVRVGVVDAVAADMEAVLSFLDGRKLADFPRPLRTRGAEVEWLRMSRRQRFLAGLSDPNIAMILMSLGAGGLFIELYSPGLILPGIVGLIALLLAFYAFQTLSASSAGVGLLLAGMLFFLLEIQVTSYGALALGGALSMVLGTLMLFRHEPLGGLSVSWTVIASSLAGLLGAAALASYVVLKAYRRKVPTGAEGMIGLGGRALSGLSPAGKVDVQGEIWDAEALGPSIPEGAEIVVRAVDGLRLKVETRAERPTK